MPDTPTHQSESQRKAALSPTATTIQVPKSGIFIEDPSFPSRLFMARPDGTFATFDITSILTEEERRNAGNFGAQVGLAASRFNELYGLDVRSLPKTNIADVMAGAFSRPQSPFGPSNAHLLFTGGKLQDFLQAAPATFETQTLNTAQNLLADPSNPASGVQQGGVLPQNLIDSTRRLIESGIMTADQGLNVLKQVAETNQFAFDSNVIGGQLFGNQATEQDYNEAAVTSSQMESPVQQRPHRWLVLKRRCNGLK